MRRKQSVGKRGPVQESARTEHVQWREAFPDRSSFRLALVSAPLPRVARRARYFFLSLYVYTLRPEACVSILRIDTHTRARVHAHTYTATDFFLCAHRNVYLFTFPEGGEERERKGGRKTGQSGRK